MSIEDTIADVLYKLLTDVNGLRYRIEDLEDEVQNLKNRIETVRVDIYNDDQLKRMAKEMHRITNEKKMRECQR